MKRVEFYLANKNVSKPKIVTYAIVESDNGIFNPITLEWYMRTSISPAMFAVSIGHERFSYKCFQKAKAFNLVFPSKEQVEETILFGSKSGRDINKLEVSGLKWFKGRYKQLPIINNSAAIYECEIVSQLRTGDHTIYVGEVKYSWINEENSPLLMSELIKK